MKCRQSVIKFRLCVPRGARACCPLPPPYWRQLLLERERITLGPKLAGNMPDTADKMPALLKAQTILLRAAAKKESIQKQKDHSADDRHDPPSDIILA